MHCMQGPCIGRCYMEKMEKEREEKGKKEKVEEEKKKKDEGEEKKQKDDKEVESKEVESEESEDTSKSQLWHQQQELWRFNNEMQTTHTFQL